MLRGNHHGIHPDGPVVLVILHSDLTLAVGTEVGELAALAHLRQAHGQLLGEGQGQGHQLRRLVAGVAEHHTLIARAVGELAVAGLLALQGLVHAQRDVGGLFVDRSDDSAGIAVEPIFAPVIADLPDHLPGYFGNVHVAGGGDLAHHVDQSGAGRGLAGHAALGVPLHNRVQHRVGNLIADLVRVALGHGLRGKKIVSCHKNRPFFRSRR
ncbi:hypothetical protein SDC9_178975 [bioreactor metagenome]|uniref:Uncharacterized protein n=1 Tax=bioreactor metagenome TaxID=1076179 RepID=A0A645GX88_9ZZZZ